ncbi:hypothetical protein [Cellulomonas fengjieae]|uniref:hypothetical protein n=1 Tax=Cellulomonas fengjieae TaxID=2819978 RepID=UPI001AAEFC02|nr:hypothetical protein [Cellulomonas fengjieae]MBO3102328.1 hypothetical protein [Cellulomonas fengjieae]
MPSAPRRSSRSRASCSRWSRWLGLNSGNTALTVLTYRRGLPPTLVMFNDMSHLPAELRWTGFPTTARA